jgi:predicted membrane protein
MISDILILLANLLVMYSLVPSIRSDQKPHIKTSIYNIIVCAIFTIAFTLLHLWVAVIMNIIVGCLWGVLVYQKLHETKPYKEDVANKAIDESMDILDSID